MTNKFEIYAIDIDGLCYIGSTNGIKRRLKDHRCRCFRPKSRHYNCKFYTYIRSKYAEEEAYKKINSGHKTICIVDTKEEARELEQEYIEIMGTLNGRMEINNISNAERCRNHRRNNLEEARNREAIYRQSARGKNIKAAYRAKNAKRRTEIVECPKCGHTSTRQHISDHRRKGYCV